MTVLDHASDRDLLELVRSGHADGDDAFATLFERHASAARGYALRYTTDVAEAEDIAAEAFFRVLQAVRRGNGPDDNMRGYLLTVVRRLAAEWHTRSRDVPIADEELSRRVDPDADHTAERAEAHLIARAFASLPQRWRSVLWQVEVEGARPAMVARHFGLSANATAALARRAREGLRAAYLQEHVPAGSGSNGCRAVVDRLGVYTAGGTRKAEGERIRAHLASCPSCRSVHAELADVCAGLSRYAGMLTPPIVGGAATVGIARLLFARPVRAVGRAVGRTLGSAAGKGAAMGARLKLVVAATSMVAVGGFGITAGPLLHHGPPGLHADGGDNLQIPVAPAISASSPGSGAGRFRDTGLGGRTPSRPAPTSSPTERSTIRPTTKSDNGAAVPVVDQGKQRNAPAPSGAGSASNQLQAGSPVTTEPTTMPTTDPTMEPATGGAGDETVWSTVWTTNGTTIWETVWQRRGP